MTDKFAVKDENDVLHYFSGLATDKQQRILDTKLLIYECEGTESEIKDWFKTINIAGVPLNPQELRNAIYSGIFVTLARGEFSNSQNTKIQKWGAYVSGSVNRQDFLDRALEWVSRDQIETYMSRHRHDTDITELRTYFNTVIDWISGVFLDVESEMRGLEWGRLYRLYHSTAYSPSEVSRQVRELYGDPYIKDRKGVFEYILGGSTDTRLLHVRIFDEATKKSTYATQTEQAKRE